MKRRLLCLLLSCFFIFTLTIPAYAGPVALNPVDYIVSLIGSACGVELPSATGAVAVLGQMNDVLEDYKKDGGDISDTSRYHDYLKNRAENGQLGPFMQWRYASEGVSSREQFFDTVDTVTSWVRASWGDSVDITFGKVNSIDVFKQWFSTFDAYKTDSLVYVPKIDFLPVQLPDRAPSDSIRLYSTYSTTTFGDIYYCDYYGPVGTKLVGVFDYHSNGQTDSPATDYYKLNAINNGQVYRIKLTEIRKHIWFDGAISYSQSKRDFVSTQDARYINFPLFKTRESALAYARDNSINYPDMAYPNSISFPVTNVNKDVQEAVLKTVPDTIALPDTGTIAIDWLNKLANALGNIKELEVVLKNAGLLVGWGDIVLPTVAPTEAETDAEESGEIIGKVTLADLIAKVEAIPATLSAIINDKFKPDEEQDPGDMKLPTDISQKFPFCIPFDVAYLAKSMSARSEVPRFELPFKIHYQNFNYENTFVVDFTQWDVAVKILRTMLDLLFIAGLISVTRDLIRG